MSGRTDRRERGETGAAERSGRLAVPLFFAAWILWVVFAG
jgi:hypothetical protein